MAAGLATLEIYQEEGLFERAAGLESHWGDAIHKLRDKPNVIDIRNMGLIGAIELAPRPGKPGARGFEAFLKCYDNGVLVRTTGDTIALSPPLIIEKAQIDELFGAIGEVLGHLD